MNRVLVLASALPLAACYLDGDVGSNARPAEPPIDAAAPDHVAHKHGGHGFHREGDDLFMLSAVDDATVPEGRRLGVVRWTPGGASTLLHEVAWRDLAVDDTSFFGVASDSTSSTRGLVRVDRTTGVTTLLTAGHDDVRYVVADGDVLYFDAQVDADTLAGNGVDTALRRIGRDGSGETVLVAGLDAVGGIAFDDAHVYVTDDRLNDGARDDVVEIGSLLAIPKAGGPATTIARGLNRPDHILVIGEWLYFTERGNAWGEGRVSRVPRPPHPAAPPEVVADGLFVPAFLVADATHVYVSTDASGIHRVALAGGDSERLAECGGEASPYPGSDSEAPPPRGPLHGCRDLVRYGDALYFHGRARDGAEAVLRIAL